MKWILGITGFLIIGLLTYVTASALITTERPVLETNFKPKPILGLTTQPVTKTETPKFNFEGKSLVRNFDNTKDISLSLTLKSKDPKTIYAGCSLTTQGKIVYNKCKYKPRNIGATAKLTTPDAEHISPASWYYNAPNKCLGVVDKREGCLKVDQVYLNYYTDLHNLQPAVAEINRDRGDRPYCSTIGGKEYGTSGVRIDLLRDCLWVPDSIKGNVARVILYMSGRYGIDLPTKDKNLYQNWNTLDPVDNDERLRNKEIALIQGNINSFIK